MNSDGTVKAEQKISSSEGGFVGPLLNGDGFGAAVCSLGDLDGDNIPDLAVSSIWADDGGFNRGAIWILFLNTDGTVKDEQKISQTSGGFTGTFEDNQYLGGWDSAAGIGDLDGDGVVDLAMGATNVDDGAVDAGAIWIFFLNPDGTVKGHQKVSQTVGGFHGNSP